MKRTIACLALVLTGVINLAAAGPRGALWKQVDDAVKKGLPKTAITNLEPIIEGALKDKNYPEATKAIAQKITLEGEIEGNKPEEKITRLDAEIAKVPAEMKPLMETILAHWYWNYFQQNRWRFMQRTQTAEAPGKDFTTWDLARMFAEIDKHFQTALAARKTLTATPIGAWDGFLEKGTLPDAYRPTLYDFIAHEALTFYTSGEQAGAKPEDAFELPLDAVMPGVPSALADAEEFVALTPISQPVSAAQAAQLEAMRASPMGKAYFLHQDLLRLHHDDPAPKVAYAVADLERLGWAWNTTTGEEKNTRYKATLEAFIKRYADLEVSALASEHEARLLMEEGEMPAAHDLAERAAKQFPKSPGGRMCRNVVIEIEAKSAEITTERVWNAPWPDITVHYRNVTAVYFRAIPVDWELFLDKHHNRPQNLTEKERREILARPAALEWSAKLPATTDFKESSLDIRAPSNLKPGYYFIVASHDPAFGEKDNVISMVDVWVSDLALITRDRDSNIEGFVLEANSGEPVAGAEIARWHLNNKGERIADPALRSDDAGFFSFKPDEGGRYLLRARKDLQEVATDEDMWWNQQDWREPAFGRVVFFTDRAIYRPGQTIQFKGICISSDPEKSTYETIKGAEVTVQFNDPNGKEIARQQFRGNDYGSFSGSFTAPRDRLMGGMSLVASGRVGGQAYLRIEEYKRPKFEVTLEAPKVAAKLNDKVSLTGHATAYNGAAVDGAPVKYRVVREVRMPWWWGWNWMGGGQSQEIAHGQARTETDGSFKIEFIAKPDRKVPATNEPTFVYSITADVTDNAGETRSADHDIRVGYTALEARLSANDWQTAGKPVELKIETKTLDGEPQAAAGVVKIYELSPPETVHRPLLDESVGRPWFNGGRGRFGLPNPRKNETNDLSNPENWPPGKVAQEHSFQTGTNGEAAFSATLGVGVYRAMLETQDRFGAKVTGRIELRVLNPDDTKLAIKIPHLLAAPDWETQPGREFMALWGTGYESGRAFVEIEHRNKIIEHYWTKPGQTQRQIKLPVVEDMRGGFEVHVTQVRENRAFLESRHVAVPWKNKVLGLKWEHFTSKLQPGAKDTWTAVITGPGAEKSTAEMVAALYDESLDAFAPMSWPAGFGVFREDRSTMQSRFLNNSCAFAPVFGGWISREQYVELTYRHFPHYLAGQYWNGRATMRSRASFGDSVAGGGIGGGLGLAPGAPAPVMLSAAASERMDFSKMVSAGAGRVMDRLADSNGGGQTRREPGNPPSGAKAPDLSQVTARKNLNETAFFFPQLMSDSNGVVRMKFTMPEALTKWHFLGFAHDRQLRGGLLEAHTVTAKDIMVQPNPPRFLREGDTVEFTVKVSNQSDKRQAGRVRLNFADVGNGNSADQLLGNAKAEQAFDIPARESRSFSWRISVPDGAPFLSYKAVASTGDLSDGEEGGVPVLTRRVFITESLPLPIRGPATNHFEFKKLAESGKSKTLQSQSLTVQMVSNPAWYAVLALPYLMEYPYECSEQTFNRLYANSLARHIAKSDPKIRRVFDQWKNTPALDSPLEKNQDLKSVMVEETPWYRDAKKESEARRNVGVLFDENRLDYETTATLQKLTDARLADGRWPWFPGGPGNDYITLYIVTGFGRLRHLGALDDDSMVRQSIARLDQWMTERYEDIQRHYSKPDEYVPSSTDALYLYGRSFFLKEQPIADAHNKAVEFFKTQSRKYWLQTACRQSQGHLAIALHRWGGDENFATAVAIMKSIKERSVSNAELGMFWRDTEESWWWYRAPIETQALIIEAFDEVMDDQPAVEDCKVWLLKQKQTQDWRTTKATADAVYALLLRGANLLASTALTEVTIGGINVTPGNGELKSRDEALQKRTKPEPGTGFYEVRFAPADIKPKLGQVTVAKTDTGVAWGAVHWQYFEDISKVTPYAGTPLKLKKTLFTKVNTTHGPVLEPLKGAVAVGDELVVRVELRTDRDMEFVHLKDQRGSGTEPVNVLSHYKYQDGLAYYESTRDTATHFFIDYLPKGVYVFEYSTRVQLRGEYQTGVAEIQCLYAPEFNSHSESIPIVVK